MFSDVCAPLHSSHRRARRQQHRILQQTADPNSPNITGLYYISWYPNQPLGKPPAGVRRRHGSLTRRSRQRRTTAIERPFSLAGQLRVDCSRRR